MTLVVTEPRHERLVAFAATTDVPQPENVSRIFRQGRAEETRQPVLSSGLALTSKRVDHVLTGRVVFEADGKRAVGATVLYQWKNVKTVEHGRYRIEGITSGPLELHAIAADSSSAPLDITVAIPEEPRQSRA